MSQSKCHTLKKSVFSHAFCSISSTLAAMKYMPQKSPAVTGRIFCRSACLFKALVASATGVVSRSEREALLQWVSQSMAFLLLYARMTCQKASSVSVAQFQEKKIQNSAARSGAFQRPC